MMRQRGDLDRLHEPFGEVVSGRKPLWQRFKEGDKIHLAYVGNSLGGHQTAC